MSALSKLKYDTSVNQETDRLGGSFSVLASDIYTGTIKYAYIQASKTGSLGLHTAYDIDGKEYSETFYMTTKEGKNFYTTKEGTKNYLAGFNHADALALFTTGEPISELDTEEKVIKLYNYEQKKEVPTNVDMVTGMVGKPINLAIIKKLEFKKTKQDNGEYVDTTETRETNSIDKIFSTKDNRTTAEVRGEFKAKFYQDWLTKNKDQVRDTTSGKAKTTMAKAGSTSPKVSSLFADE